MTLQELIDTLKKADQNHIAKRGFSEPMSYRGDYYQVAFNPVRNVTVASMLAHAESALDQEFEGYKGGTYLMHGGVDCYICQYGASDGDKIGKTLAAYLTGEL